MHIFGLSMFYLLPDSSIRSGILLRSSTGFYAAMRIRKRFSIYEDDDRDGDSTWSQGFARLYGALIALAIAIFLEHVTAQY